MFLFEGGSDSVPRTSSRKGEEQQSERRKARFTEQPKMEQSRVGVANKDFFNFHSLILQSKSHTSEGKSSVSSDRSSLGGQYYLASVAGKMSYSSFHQPQQSNLKF